MLFLSVLSVAPFMRKGWSWSVVIEAVWVAELKMFTVSPSDRQVRGLPALVLSVNRPIQFRQGCCSLVVKNTASRIRSMFESWLHHLTCCKTLCISSPEPQFPHLKNGDVNKCYHSRRMVAKIASPWPRVSTQSMFTIPVVVVVVIPGH